MNGGMDRVDCKLQLIKIPSFIRHDMDYENNSPKKNC